MTKTALSRCASFIALAIASFTPGTSLAHDDDKAKAAMHHGSSGPATIKVEFAPTAAPYQAGAETTALIRLSDAQGKPVTFEQLELAHTKKIHLLIIDEGLTDYHHQHPVPTENAGEYAFIFKPAKGGRYTVFADLLPTATHKQEYAKTEVAVAGTAVALDQSAGRVAIVDGYKFELSIEGDAILRVGEGTLAKVKVTKPDGQPANNLEPVMGAFAHGVGFPADCNGVVHVHPLGKEPEQPSERGGPDLSFHVVPEHAGYMKFYVQVQIDGRDRFAGFGFNVEKAAEVAASPTPAPETTLTPGQKQLLAQYEAVRSALSADDFAAAKKAAASLTSSKEAAAPGAAEIAKSSSIKDAREAFKKLSAHAAMVVAQQPGYFVMACPMVKEGTWVQLTRKVENPYMGGAMLGCGAIKK